MNLKGCCGFPLAALPNEPSQPSSAQPAPPSLISPASPPHRRGQANNEKFEFGAETRVGDDSSMDEAFKAAGWTGQGASDPSKVDTARSPGLSRNFGDIDVADFRSVEMSAL